MKTIFQNRLDDFQPIPIRRKPMVNDINKVQEVNFLKKNRKDSSKSKFIVTIVMLVIIYFFAPIRSNILILGTDFLPHRELLSRTDTNIILTINPLKPYVGMLSVPRDLWVVIPGYGENRINTAYFFAEASQPGSGPLAALETFHKNFGITLKYFVVINMESVVKVIDSMGGVEVDLPSDMGGLLKGVHQLTGTQALAFARERYSADDFSRMIQGQILIKAALKKLFTPSSFLKIPMVILETLRAVDTNISWWLFPRLGVALLRSGPSMDNQIITREMVTPYTTDQGAQVLIPNWDAINPVLLKMFGE